jgi:hypothetical protein
MSKWPVVKLGEVVTPIQREEKVDAAKAYHLLGGNEIVNHEKNVKHAVCLIHNSTTVF